MARSTANSRARSSCSAMSALSTPMNATPMASSRSTWVMVKVRSNTSSEPSRSARLGRTFERLPSPVRSQHARHECVHVLPGRGVEGQPTHLPVIEVLSYVPRGISTVPVSEP